MYASGLVHLICLIIGIFRFSVKITFCSLHFLIFLSLLFWRVSHIIIVRMRSLDFAKRVFFFLRFWFVTEISERKTKLNKWLNGDIIYYGFICVICLFFWFGFVSFLFLRFFYLTRYSINSVAEYRKLICLQ